MCWEALTALKIVCLLVAYFISLGLAWHCGALNVLRKLDKAEDEKENEMLEDMYQMILLEHEEKNQSREALFRELTSPVRSALTEEEYHEWLIKDHERKDLDYGDEE